jgi:hypothetical protein
MSITADRTGPQRTVAQPSRIPRPPSVVLCVFTALIVFLAYAGYVLHWSWIGLNGHSATLWQWLNLVLFPLAIAVVPILYLRRTTLTMPGKGTLLAGVAAVGLFVLASYEVPLRWTGFSGNTLWDWLKLLLPPLAVVSVACAGSLRSVLRSEHGLLVTGLIVVLAVPVLGGYLWGWEWTGFARQTLWDWLRLLLLPLAIPTVVCPALTAVAREMVARAALAESGDEPPAAPLTPR